MVLLSISCSGWFKHPFHGWLKHPFQGCTNQINTLIDDSTMKCRMDFSKEKVERQKPCHEYIIINHSKLTFTPNIDCLILNATLSKGSTICLTLTLTFTIKVRWFFCCQCSRSPGGPLSRYVLTCVSENSQKRVPFSKQGSDLSRSSIINFRDMGVFQNLPEGHVNIGFYLSDTPPPRGVGLYMNRESG